MWFFILLIIILEHLNLQKFSIKIAFVERVIFFQKINIKDVKSFRKKLLSMATKLANGMMVAE